MANSIFITYLGPVPVTTSGNDVTFPGAVTVGTLELGSADTTFARVSAGVASIEGATIATGGSSPSFGTVTATTRYLAGDGSVSAPAFSFTSDSDTGAYWTNGNFNISLNGARVFSAQATTALFAGITIDTVNQDVSLARAAARVLILGPTTGARMSWATDGTVAFQSFAGADTAIVKTATLNATVAYQANGTPGVTAGPFTTITSITVTNGLVTALTGS